MVEFIKNKNYRDFNIALEKYNLEQLTPNLLILHFVI